MSKGKKNHAFAFVIWLSVIALVALAVYLPFLLTGGR